jgi:hypothetical protein
MSKLAKQFTLSTVSAAEVSCVTVMFEELMTASLPGPGTAPPVHIEGLLQSPLTSLAQVMDESKVRISSPNTAGRNTRRSTGDEVRKERSNLRRMGASPELTMRIKDQM